MSCNYVALPDGPPIVIRVEKPTTQLPLMPDFSHEIKAYICSCLPPQDIASVACLNKKWKAAADCKDLWKPLCDAQQIEVNLGDDCKTLWVRRHKADIARHKAEAEQREALAQEERDKVLFENGDCWSIVFGLASGVGNGFNAFFLRQGYISKVDQWGLELSNQYAAISQSIIHICNQQQLPYSRCKFMIDEAIAKSGVSQTYDRKVNDEYNLLIPLGIVASIQCGTTILTELTRQCIPQDILRGVNFFVQTITFCTGSIAIIEGKTAFGCVVLATTLYPLAQSILSYKTCTQWIGKAINSLSNAFTRCRRRPQEE